MRKKRMYSKIFFFVLIILLATECYADSRKLKFVFLNPETPDDYWWKNASGIMQSACDDFGIDLKIYYANLNRHLMTRQMKEAVSGDEKPDAVIFHNRKLIGPTILKIAEEAKVVSFIFNAGLSEMNKKIYGGPREKFVYWIGQMLPSDEQAGYDLAKILFAEAENKKMTDDYGKIHVIGLGGTISDIASIERLKGLKKAVQENPRVILHQTAPASWTREIGKKVFLGLKRRYTGTRVVWAANDPMGLGAIDGIRDSGITPGKDILIGSIDWIPEAVEAVKKGELSVSIGGHFMESAWSIVLLYDYFNGFDFIDETLNFKSKMGILTKNNIEKNIHSFGKKDWEKVDFTKFSKKLNKDLNTYDFTFEALLQNM